MSKTVLITGGAGFIGRYVTEAMLNQGFDVRSLDFAPGALRHDRLTHWGGSFLDDMLLAEALTGVDCVFHLAATGFAREANTDPVRDCRDNVLGTLSLLELAARAGVRRLIYCSSGGTVYGPTDAVPIHEDHATNPITAYGISKLACEKYMRFFNGEGRISTLTLRVANPYGPHQNIAKAQGALTTFCHRAVSDEPITIWGDGSVERDFVEIRDVARAFVLAHNAEASGTEINIGSGRGVSLNQLIAMIAEVLGRPIDHGFTEGRGFDVPRNYLDIQRAQAMLGWQPEIPVEDGVRSLIEWMQAQQGATQG